MRKVAILVAAIAVTLSLNTKVFATGVVDPSTVVNKTTVTSEAVQETTVKNAGEVIDNTSTDTNIDEVEKKDTGIMPDSMFYFVDKAFENIRLFLTFDDEKKIEIISQIADERLAEGENMTKEEKYEFVKSTIEEFNNLIVKANDIVPEEEKLEDLEKNILPRQLKSIEVLKKLSEKLEGNAKESIQAVIEMQLAKKEAVANMVDKRHELNEARKQYQLVKVDLKQIKKTEDVEAIKVAEEALKVKEGLYEEAKEEFKIAFDAKKAAKSNTKKDAEKVQEVKKVEVEETKAVEEVKVVEDAKIVEEVKAVKKGKEIKEVKEVKEIKEVKEAKEVKKAKEVKRANEGKSESAKKGQ